MKDIDLKSNTIDQLDRKKYERRFLPFLLALGILALMAMPQRGKAHGGVVIDTGFTDHFEWLVSIDPYPTLMGEAMVTLLVYDIATYEPVNDLTVAAHPMAPAETQPCCAPTADAAPISLTIDPAIYPGDYSNLLPLDQPGEWSIRFVATAPDSRSEQSFEVVVPLTVHASMGGSVRIPIEAAGTPDVEATATAFAANVNEARQSPSPLIAMNSPLTGTDGTAGEPAETIARQAFAVQAERGGNWLLWGGLGLIPILLIGWFTLRSNERAANGSPTDLSEQNDHE